MNNSRSFDIINTSDVVSYNALVNTQKNSPVVQNSINRIRDSIHAVEKSKLEESAYYPVKMISDNLYKLDVNKVKSLVRDNFYDPTLMKEIFYIMNSIAYLQPNTPGAVNPNERVKEWLKNLQRIGTDSFEGVAFKSDLRTSQSAFVIKSPKSAKNDLLHEFTIGLELNDLRAYVPNFAYVFGGFKCTPPILKDISYSGVGVSGLPINSGKIESIPVSWCDNSNINTVQYIIYENISPGVSMKDYVSRCTFEQFLDKYLQVMFAILAWQENKEGSHGDLHYENVIVKESQEKELTIPYTTEMGGIEYLKTDSIATIIDYGFGSMKLKNETHIGITGAEAYGVFYDKYIPIHDAYKFLMFCMMGMLQQKNFACYQGAILLYRFFNKSEDPAQAIALQSKYLFMTPYNQKTISVKLNDYIGYIRTNIPQFNLIVTSSPQTRHILGCTGNDICMSSNGVLKVLGFDSKKVIDNIFDFYDLVSRLEDEKRINDIDEILLTVNPDQLVSDGISKYNESIVKIQEYFQTDQRDVITLKGMDLNLLKIESVRTDYKNFLIETAEINEAFERLVLIYDCLIFLSKYFNINLKDVDDNYLIMNEYYTDLLMILDIIKEDALILGPSIINQLQLPELEILSKNII